MFSSIYDNNNTQRDKEEPISASQQEMGLAPLQGAGFSTAEIPTLSSGLQSDYGKKSAGSKNPMSGIGWGQAIGGAANAIGSAIPRDNEFNNRNYRDKVQVEEEAREQAVGQTKDQVASAFGPIGEMWRGIEKGGNAIGEGIGGDTGNYVSAAFSPDEAIMAANSDPDISTGDKALGMLLPFHAAKMSRKAKEARKREYEQRMRIQENINQKVKREADQRMQDGLDQIADMKVLKQQQLGMLSSTY